MKARADKTNTFACYRQTLGENADVSENVRAAVKIAKSCRRKDILLQGIWARFHR